MTLSSIHRMPLGLCFLMLGIATTFLKPVNAQRFLREGFSSQMDQDFRGEMKLDEASEAQLGMTREMFLLQDSNVPWELQPPQWCTEEEEIIIKTRGNTDEVQSWTNPSRLDPALRRHIQQCLAQPIQIQLLRQKGKYGMRAIARRIDHSKSQTNGDGKKKQSWRAFWRPAVTTTPTGRSPLRASDLLSVPYDTAVRSRLCTMEFEIQLPALPRSKQPSTTEPASTSDRKSSRLPPPSVVYEIPFEPGSMNPKCMVPRSAATIRIYPAGRDLPPLKGVGRSSVNIAMRSGMVDPSWAKGRAIFRRGRSTGLL